MALSLSDGPILKNGVRMPWLGLGVWKVKNGAPVVNAVKFAIRTGYRSIDTAAIYGNEEGVGQAVRDSGVPREELFVTSKVWNADQGYDRTLRAFEESLARLGFDYLDLYLVHWPVKGLYKDTWRALETLYREGRVRAIGVSNFLIHHLEDLMGSCEITPMVNQIELHPRLAQPELVDFCKRHGIQPEAWSPLMQGRLDDPTLREIGARYGKSPAQVVLRWHVQRGVIVIPKSVRPERIRENADIFDFALDEEDMRRIDAMDRGERIGPYPDHIDF